MEGWVTNALLREAEHVTRAQEGWLVGVPTKTVVGMDHGCWENTHKDKRPGMLLSLDLLLNL